MNSWQTLWDSILWPAIIETLYMTIIALIISAVIAFFLAIILVVTGEHGLRPNKVVYRILDVIVNIFRSIPFIILAVSITPLTRMIVGSSVGSAAAIVPLTVASAPFMARLFENSMNEVNPSLIEAARSFGASTSQIVRGVIVKESIPSLVMDTTLASITLLGLTAMAGAIGAGGLGAVALTYGYQSFNETIMFTTVVFLIIITALIQLVGQVFYRRLR